MNLIINSFIKYIVIGLIFKIFRGIGKGISSLFSSKQNQNMVWNIQEVEFDYVVDGDTISIKVDDIAYRIRLYAIDTPEKYDSEKMDKDIQNSNSMFKKLLNKNVSKDEIIEAGQLASQFMKDIKTYANNHNFTVKILPIEKDKYDRVVGILYVNDKNINELMVSEGYAIAYTAFIKEKEVRDYYINLQNTAKYAEKGLWKSHYNVMNNL